MPKLESRVALVFGMVVAAALVSCSGGEPAPERVRLELSYKRIAELENRLYERRETAPWRIAVACDEAEGLRQYLTKNRKSAAPESAYADPAMLETIAEFEHGLGVFEQLGRDMLLLWNEDSSLVTLRRHWEELRGRLLEPLDEFRHSSEELDLRQSEREPKGNYDLRLALAGVEAAAVERHRFGLIVESRLEMGTVNKDPHFPKLRNRYSKAYSRHVHGAGFAWRRGSGPPGVAAAWRKLGRIGELLFYSDPWPDPFVVGTMEGVRGAVRAAREAREALGEAVEGDPASAREPPGRHAEWTKLARTGGVEALAARLEAGRKWPRIDGEEGNELLDALIGVLSEDLEALRRLDFAVLAPRVRAACRLSDAFEQAGGLRNATLGVLTRWAVRRHLLEALVRNPMRVGAVEGLRVECAETYPDGSSLLDEIRSGLSEDDAFALTPYENFFRRDLNVAWSPGMGDMARFRSRVLPQSGAQLLTDPDPLALLWADLAARHQHVLLHGLIQVVADRGGFDPELDRDDLAESIRMVRLDAYCAVCEGRVRGYGAAWKNAGGWVPYIDLFWRP